MDFQLFVIANFLTNYRWNNTRKFLGRKLDETKEEDREKENVKEYNKNKKCVKEIS